LAGYQCSGKGCNHHYFFHCFNGL